VTDNGSKDFAGGIMAAERFIPLEGYREYPVDEMKERAAAFRADMQRRRST